MQDQNNTFNTLFSPRALSDTLRERFVSARSKGIDRLNGVQFAQRSTVALATTSAKCLNGSFRFSPYLETLKLKGRGKTPRVVGIPTIRDRIVLHQLNVFLKLAFPECVPARIANGYIRQISEDLRGRANADTFVYGCDIKSFYDAIPREKLLTLLARSIHVPHALLLIRHAIDTPVVVKNSTRFNRDYEASRKGVPQGLAISNILAAIYLHSVDTAMKHDFNVTYFRYVDDILIYGSRHEVEKAKGSLKPRLQRRGLAIHPEGSGKTHLSPLSRTFGYLGYTFKWPTITVRESTVERLLQSISAMFSNFSHNKQRRLEKHAYLDINRLKDIFILELNDRITGAISGNQRFGWVAYFSQINDLQLLHKLDDSVRHMFSRLPEFDRQRPSTLKRFARAFFEIKYRPNGGYIRNYDANNTPMEMLRFLQARGRINPDETLSEQQIESRYRNYVARALSAMQADEGTIY